MDVNVAISLMTTVREADSKVIGLAGYSAGVWLQRDARIEALAALLPPFSTRDLEFSKGYLKPKAPYLWKQR